MRNGIENEHDDKDVDVGGMNQGNESRTFRRTSTGLFFSDKFEVISDKVSTLSHGPEGRQHNPTLPLFRTLFGLSDAAVFLGGGTIRHKSEARKKTVQQACITYNSMMKRLATN